MQHIRSISDLNPQSVGIANRATESVNIIGHVLEDILNGFGGALADITGQHHGSHLNINHMIPFEEARLAEPTATLKTIRRAANVSATVPVTRDTIGDTERVQDFIDKRF